MKFLLILLITHHVFAFQSDFKPINQRTPLEFVYLFDSLKNSIKSQDEKLKMVGLIKDIDDHLGQLADEQIFFLMKSEVIKNTLDYKFKQTRSFDINSQLIVRLENILKNNDVLLTPFSKWIHRSIIAELKQKEKSGLVNQDIFNPEKFDGAKKIEALRFKKYLFYLMPWIDRIDALSPYEFNLLTKDVAWITLRRLNDRSKLFLRYSSTSLASTKTPLFNIPDKLLTLEEAPKNKESEPLSLSEKAKMEKNEAKSKVEEVSPEDLSPLSDEISKKLEEKN